MFDDFDLYESCEEFYGDDEYIDLSADEWDDGSWEYQEF